MSKTHHPAIVVGAPREGFRRAGHSFGTRPKTIPLASLSPAEHAAIINDRALVVVQTAIQLEAVEAEALKHHEAPHVRKAAALLATVPIVTDGSAAGQETDLKNREKALQARHEHLDRVAKQADDVAAAQAERSAALDEREKQIAAREKAIEESAARVNAALDVREKAIEARESSGRQGTSSKATGK